MKNLLLIFILLLLCGCTSVYLQGNLSEPFWASSQRDITVNKEKPDIQIVNGGVNEDGINELASVNSTGD